MNLEPAIDDLAASIEALAEGLSRLAEDHATEHDIFHTGHLLSRRIADLRSFVRAGGDDLRAEPVRSSDRPLDTVRRLATDALKRTPRSGPALLADLRDLVGSAAICEADWMIVHQGAMAARDVELTEGTLRGMAETRRVSKWLITRIKESSPQILMAE